MVQYVWGYNDICGEDFDWLISTTQILTVNWPYHLFIMSFLKYSVVNPGKNRNLISGWQILFRPDRF